MDEDARRYLIISSDGHVGPSLENQLRLYCPSSYLAEFDEYVSAYRASMDRRRATMRPVEHARPEVLEAVERTQTCKGLGDAHAFIADMDAEGIAASVLFGGGQNEETLPWVEGFGMGSVNTRPELRALGFHIWNAWLADFVAAAPHRFLGLIHIPIWDLDAAIREMKWGRDRGLKGVNFPAPRADYPGFNEPLYDRFFAAAADLGLPLVTHAGGGEVTPGRRDSPGAYMIHSFEAMWLGRRGLPQMLCGGVFERHPSLSVVYAEQRLSWVGETLRDLDSCYLDPNRDYSDRPSRRPSEYWSDNCLIGASFIAPYEVAMREQVGVRNIMWGSDYPHAEGTWPRTLLALRNSFAGVNEDEVRLMLGENAARVFDVDVDALRRVANQIGPTPEALSKPLSPEEFPTHRGLAFREFGIFA